MRPEGGPPTSNESSLILKQKPEAKTMVTNTNDEKTKTGQLPSDRILMVTAPRFQNCWGHHIEAMISQSCIKRIIRVWSITNQKETIDQQQRPTYKFEVFNPGDCIYHIYRIYIIKLIIISINIHHIYTIYCSGTEYLVLQDRGFCLAARTAVNERESVGYGSRWAPRHQRLFFNWISNKNMIRMW